MKIKSNQAYVISIICMYIQDKHNDKGICYDDCFEFAQKMSDVFIGGEYDVDTKPLYDCIEKFLMNSKEFDTFINDEPTFKSSQEFLELMRPVDFTAENLTGSIKHIIKEAQKNAIDVTLAKCKKYELLSRDTATHIANEIKNEIK